MLSLQAQDIPAKIIKEQGINIAYIGNEENMTIEKLKIPLEELVKMNQKRTISFTRRNNHSKSVLHIHQNLLKLFTFMKDCEPHRVADLDYKLAMHRGEVHRMSEHLVRAKCVEIFKINNYETYHRITEKGLKLYELFKEDMEPSE